jgi:lantibiotic modifying enzyme
MTNLRETPAAPRLETDRETFLQAATTIGRALVESARWTGCLCAWPDAHTPDLYGGSSGVALFLGELYRLTGDGAFRRTALGAVRHALTSAGTVAPHRRAGLFTGWCGIAVVAGRLGILLSDGAVAEQAGPLLRSGAAEAGGSDLLAGRAGSVIALLLGARLLGQPDLVPLAATLGAHLLCTPADAGRPGIAHGASGIALALFALHDATGELHFREAAVRTLAMERRLVADVTWCQGAAGMALTRLTGFALTGEEACRTEAAALLQRTADAVEANVSRLDADATLCHGLTGQAEALLSGSRLLAYQATNLFGTAWEVGRAVAGYFGSLPAPGQVAPGFMQGVAGAGYLLLRLHDPRTPSVLRLQPGDWAIPQHHSREDRTRFAIHPGCL